MPLFEFRCHSCGHQWSDLAKRDSPRSASCPLCRGEGVRLLATGTRYRYTIGSFFEPFITEDITGDPVLVTSPEHERQLCRENNLIPVPGHAKLR